MRATMKLKQLFKSFLRLLVKIKKKYSSGYKNILIMHVSFIMIVLIEIVVRIELKKIELLLSAILLVLIYFSLISFINKFFNFIFEIEKRPENIYRLSPKDLRRMKFLYLWKSIIKNANVSEETFLQTLAFFNSNSEQKANTFSQSIGAISCDKKGEFYQLKMGDDFNLSSLRNFLLYISDEPSQSIYKKLVGLNDKIFVLTSEVEQNNMAKLAHEKSNRLLAPSLKELTAFLLSSDKEQEFISILSKCLLFKDVSPYQINGDVKNENNFFGRVEILREIISNNSANYLLVGARQLGKSSVLKALERRYEQNELCYHAFTLDESGDVMTALCKALNLVEGSSLEQVVDTIKAEKQKVIFLIDEADKFVQNEKENGYLLTSVFRKLAQEGEAMFILAGFWTLYEYVTLDYQSPLKNFGKLIILGGLEKEACRELMLEPMERIGIQYEDESIVEKTIELCGYRANYIATVCDVVLQSLEHSSISQKDVDDALESDAIDKMLKGWGAMSANEKVNRLDRLIVYMTIEKESFRLGDVVTAIKEKGLSIDTQKIDESLERLVLGYVVGKHKGNYTYRIPLLRERLLEEDLAFLIEGEILGLK
ncbi:MAG: Unknown protein [uncultured Sulfurovum sp.]|uniref:Uncharacterized protein n=1 Tax=uncultured Sulfurovum sp. TaxID=269237 RepID=A0A6S6TA09_9BACT|nr:MAG: Unknown protein [uncultured Sulfurovum sp.]